jgi:hypothetical protein
MFLGAQPVIIILPSTLATDFLSHAHTIRPVLAPMTTLWTGSLDIEFSGRQPVGKKECQSPRRNNERKASKSNLCH